MKIFASLAVAVCAAVVVCGPVRAGDVIGAVCDKAGNCVTGDQKIVTRAEWGKLWPFTTEEAVLVCVRDIGPFGQLFVVGGLP